MDWNMKATSWDFSEFMEEAVPSTEAVHGSSDCGVRRNKGDFSVDLKLGRVGNSGEESMNKWEEPGELKMESSPSKRARATNNGTHQVSCLVDGCNSDLSNCRDYHRRHKVCELHSKSPQVMINGQKQRFCQQCSRFHSLEEFDEGKRSCRKRLDGHNRRRRKPQPDLTRSGSYFSNYQGAQMLPFSSLHVYPSTTVVKATWPGVTNSETDSRHLNQQQQLHSPVKQNLVLGSSSGNYKGGKPFTFLQGENNTPQNHTLAETSSICQPLLKAAPFSEGSGGSHNMFCDSLTTPVQDSDCALSLLSSPQTQTSGISLSSVVQPHSFALVQPLGQSLQNHIVEPLDSVVVANGRDAAVHCPGMFRIGSSGSSGAEASQTLPFHWQ